MEVHRTYPVQSPKNFFKRNRQDIFRSVFAFIGYACLIINLLTGGRPWSLIVIGGLCVFWVVFIYKPLVENTLIKKLSDISIAVCLYLFLLDMILHQGWSGFVVRIVFFSDLLLIGFIFLVFFNREKRNFMPLFELILGGFIAITLSLVGVWKLDWAAIVVGSVSLGLLILSVALFPKDMARELKKKLHM